MKQNSMRKMLSVIGCMVLIAAMALNLIGCSSKAPTASEGSEVTFTLTVTDLEGKETSMEITTTKSTVGEALLEQGLIEGDPSEYGLYVHVVNGIRADWDNDQTYWAFYIDGEYAMTGVDDTPIDPACAYSFVLTKE
ncbi:MAG: DUF4430 domain-containing protein [Oscillospiraceae bacterium]|nr:DUF4430 domain-containing protein [Oscillospiraceae bacterium]